MERTESPGLQPQLSSQLVANTKCPPGERSHCGPTGVAANNMKQKNHPSKLHDREK